MRSKIIITVFAAFASLLVIAGAGAATAASTAGAARSAPHTSTTPATGHHRQPARVARYYVRLLPSRRPEYQWRCDRGYSCYYDGRDGTGQRWVAPRCGWHQLGSTRPRFDDRISSIWNRGRGAIDLYDAYRGRWVYLGTVPLNARGNLPPSLDNRVDAIQIAC